MQVPMLSGHNTSSYNYSSLHLARGAWRHKLGKIRFLTLLNKRASKNFQPPGRYHLLFPWIEKQNLRLFWLQLSGINK